MLEMVKRVKAIRYEGESSEVMETIVNDEEILLEDFRLVLTLLENLQ